MYVICIENMIIIHKCFSGKLNLRVRDKMIQGIISADKRLRDKKQN